MSQFPSDAIRQIIDEIVADIEGRSEIGDVLEKIEDDEEVFNEMTEKWYSIIEKIVNSNM